MTPRKPIVFDPDIGLMHFIEAASEKTLSSIVTWADHPETPWSENTQLTADYCGYLRDALANGVLAGFLGLIDRGYVRWRTLRTEVALLTLGETSIACVPGEIYPEIVNGGIEQAQGGDFQVAPVEVPPLRQLMPGRIKFIFGLANDEVGYLIPKSEWDEKPPYLYGADHAPYGEINSVGPDAAGTVHSALKQLCGRVQVGLTPDP
jgi:hypothetical protein